MCQLLLYLYEQLITCICHFHSYIINNSQFTFETTTKFLIVRGMITVPVLIQKTPFWNQKGGTMSFKVLYKVVRQCNVLHSK